MDVCRLCHLETPPKFCKNLFVRENRDIQILEILETLTGLKLYENDIFPKTACVDCYVKLISFYNFRKLVLQADEKFHQDWYATNLVSDVKIEVDDPLVKPGKVFENNYRDYNLISVENVESANGNNESQEPLENLQSVSAVEEGNQIYILVQEEAIGDPQLPNIETQQIEAPKIKIETENLPDYNENLPNNVADSSNIDKNLLHDDEDLPIIDEDDSYDPQKQYHCDFCPKSFSKGHYLTVHRRIHTGERPYLCNVCGKGFAWYQNYKVHMTNHSAEHPYLCDICGKKYKKKGALDTHKELHSNDKFICEVCKMVFHNRRNLVAHSLIHQNRKKRMYPCKICNKSLPSSSNLAKHMRTHTGEKPWSCELCHATFSVKRSLRDHYRIHTNDKPYNCHLCYKSFRVKYSLTIHIRTHTGEKPYTCKICNKSFRVGSCLNEHMLTHSDKNPIACHICNKTFGRKDVLKLHLKRHEEKDKLKVENKPSLIEIAPFVE